MQSTERQNDTSAVDERGTSQESATTMLQEFCDKHFDGDLSKTALVLGRSEEDLQAMLSGNEPIDDDLVMKVRGIDAERSGPQDATTKTEPAGGE